LIAYACAALLIVILVGIFYLVGAAIPKKARSRFLTNRERLCVEFFTIASASGKPRGLLWKSLDWTAGEPTLARDRKSGEIVALLPVTIQFEAVVGGDMEGLPAVGNLRNASAVFFYRRGRWHASGRAVFNLNPDEALVHFKDQYAPLEPLSPRAVDTP
jgi:hypothetical protein